MSHKKAQKAQKEKLLLEEQAQCDLFCAFCAFLWLKLGERK
jgi:hypothetical protein